MRLRIGDANGMGWVPGSGLRSTKFAFRAPCLSYLTSSYLTLLYVVGRGWNENYSKICVLGVLLVSG